MLSTLDLLETNLRDLSHADLILAVDHIAEKGAAHSGLQDVPEDVPGPSVLKELNVDFAATVQAAFNGDRLLGEERDAKWLNLVESVIMWGQHIIMRFKRRKDPSILQNNGFAQKKQVVKKTVSKDVSPVPSQVRVKHGASSGWLTVLAKRIAGNGSFELRFTTDPNDEASWTDGGHHTYCQMKLNGFVPGTKYYFSLRYHGIGGTSDWCAPVSIIAL